MAAAAFGPLPPGVGLEVERPNSSMQMTTSGSPSSGPRGCVEEIAVAPAGRERVTLAAGVEVLPVITQGWRIYFVARYMLDA